MKHIVTFLVVLLALAAALPAAVQEKPAEPRTSSRAVEPVLRTYTLKFVDPREVMDLIAPLVIQKRADTNARLLVVVLYPDNVKPLEELLAKVDVEAKTIQFRIFTLVASMGDNAPALNIPELQGVVQEISRVLRYNVYALDGVSSLTVRAGTQSNNLMLNSRLDGLALELARVRLNTPPGGKPQVSSGIRLLRKEHLLLQSEQTTIEEGGYIVVGVSKLNINDSGDALVLVIHAVVK